MHINIKGNWKKNAKRFSALLMTGILIMHLLLVDIVVLGASTYAFAGYNNDNITSATFEYAYSSETTVTGNDVVMDDEAVGEAIGYIALDDSSADISEAIDLGGLEIDFSVTSVVIEEGGDGADNDIPTVDIYFCSDSNFGGPDEDNVLGAVKLEKSDNSVAGSEVLTSNASIPIGTRAVFIYLTGINTVFGSENTIEFRDISLIIYDTQPPVCLVDYDNSWTNDEVSITVSASDSDSGLEGIYIDDQFVTAVSPYIFTVTENTAFTVYSKDLSGKSSDTINTSVNNIDTANPATPDTLTLSQDNWTNEDVTITMPELIQSGGSPEKYVYQINSDEWEKFINPMVFDQNGISNISIAVLDEAGNISGSVSDVIYIDKLNPSIDSVDQTVSVGQCLVDVTVSDTGLSGINETKYAIGSQPVTYFETGGTIISNGTFTISAGGIFTIFVSDVAGNYDIHEYDLNTAPNLQEIEDQSINEDESINIPIHVSDNETALNDLIITAQADDQSLVPNIVINQSSSAISIDIVPALNVYGSTEITVEVEDTSGEKTSTQFALNIAGENDAPVAEDDSGIILVEDSEIAIDVLANDMDDADGDTLTVSDIGTPSNGTSKLDSGIITYTPNLNFNGNDSFLYTISDGNGGFDTATVNIIVTPSGG